MGDIHRIGEESYFNRRLRAIQNSGSREVVQDVVWLTTLDWYLDGEKVISTDNFHQLVGAALDRINELKKEGR